MIDGMPSVHPIEPNTPEPQPQTLMKCGWLVGITDLGEIIVSTRNVLPKGKWKFPSDYSEDDVKTFVKNKGYDPSNLKI